MNTVPKKTSTSKKERTDRRIVAQAERENGGGMPASEEIQRPADRANLSTRGLPVGSVEDIAAFGAEQHALEMMSVRLTLKEACQLVGVNTDPRNFAVSALEVAARDLDVLADLPEERDHFDRWCAFQSLRARIEFAGKIAKVLAAKAAVSP